MNENNSKEGSEHETKRKIPKRKTRVKMVTCKKRSHTKRRKYVGRQR
jgi:hypothetical protein